MRDKFTASQKNDQSNELPIEIIQDINRVQAQLINQRKLRRKQQDYLLRFPTLSEMKNFTLKVQRHICEPSCLDVNLEKDSLIVVGGTDGSLHLIDLNEEKVGKHQHHRID